MAARLNGRLMEKRDKSAETHSWGSTHGRLQQPADGPASTRQPLS